MSKSTLTGLGQIKLDLIQERKQKSDCDILYETDSEDDVIDDASDEDMDKEGLNLKMISIYRFYQLLLIKIWDRSLQHIIIVTVQSPRNLPYYPAMISLIISNH